MKIELITHRYPPDLGGIENHVQELAFFLDEEGHDVTVRATRWSRSQPRFQEDEGVPILRHQALAPGEAYYFSPGIIKAVQDSEADVIHAHGYHSFPALFAALGSGTTPFVITPHYTGSGSTFFRDQLHRIYGFVGGAMLRRADRVIAVSDWEHHALNREFRADSIVIENGIDKDRFAGAEPINRERPFLFYIGRLVKHKGVQHIIRALPKLPEYDLIIAGKGSYRQELERIAVAEGVSERIHFMGYVDDERVPSMFASADVHLLLSDFECYGLTVGESLTSGTPCVVQDSTALSDWIDHQGCVGISSTDPDTVANAVRSATEITPSSENILSWTEMGRTVLDVYHEVQS